MIALTLSNTNMKKNGVTELVLMIFSIKIIRNFGKSAEFKKMTITHFKKKYNYINNNHEQFPHSLYSIQYYQHYQCIFFEHVAISRKKYR